MLTVIPNKNIIFLTLLLNLLNPKDREKFYLYKKISKKFNDLIPKSFIDDFRREYKGENPLSILYRYISLSICLDEDFLFNFSKSEERELLQFEKFSKDISFFRNSLTKLYKDIEFDSFYKRNIEEEYEKLCREIQGVFDEKENILEVLIDFWRLKYKPGVIFVPNFAALGDNFGFRRNKTFFSITSPKINKTTGKSEYSTVHIYSNTIHELSHSFFDETIEKKYSQEELSKKVKKLDVDENVIKTYGPSYFEECFVRASTIRLNEILNIYNLAEGELKEKIEKYLLSNDNLGYLLVRVFYKKLISRNNQSLESIFYSII